MHQSASKTWRASSVFRFGDGATAQDALDALRVKFVTEYAELGELLGAEEETD